MAVNKIYPDAKAALAGLLRDGMTIMSGGFGLCGIPSALIEAIRDSGVKDLTIISNNAGIDDVGLGLLLQTRQVRKMISSYVGENATFAQAVSRRRTGDRVQPAGHAGGTHPRGRRGHPGVLHRDRRRHADRRGQAQTRSSTAAPTCMERGLRADLAVIHAWKADPEGNLIYRKTARNFNPIMATAGGRRWWSRSRNWSSPARSIPTTSSPPASSSTASSAGDGRQTDRTAHRAQARTEGGGDHALDPRSDGRPRGARIARRVLRQSRHRHSDAGGQPPPRGDVDPVALGERHARHGAVPVRGRGRRRPDQRRQADGDRAADHQLLRQRRQLRHGARRAYRHLDPGRACRWRRTATWRTG